MRYRDAGVDISRSDAIKDEILREVRATWGARRATAGRAGSRASWPTREARRCSRRPWTASAPSCTSPCARGGSRTRPPISSTTAPTTCSCTARGRWRSSITSPRRDWSPRWCSRSCAGSLAPVARWARCCSAARPPRCRTPTCRAWWTSPAACSARSIRALLLDGSRVRPGDALLGLAGTGPAHERLLARAPRARG